MNEAIVSMAHDFSSDLSDELGVDVPADGFFSPLVKIFGRNPSKKEILHFANEGICDLTKVLSSFLDREIDDDVVKDVTMQAIVNYYGDA